MNANKNIIANDKNKNDSSIYGIVQAIENNDLILFKENLPYFTNINKPIRKTHNKHSYTLLEVAAIYNRLEIAKILIGNGANVNTIHKYYGTPLIIAVTHNNLAMTDLFIQAGANVNFIHFAPDSRYMDYNGSALHIAAKQGYFDAAKLLLSNGANSNAIASMFLSYNYSPLELAIIYAHIDIFDLLINHPSIFISDKDLNSLLKKALNSGEKHVVLTLLELLKKKDPHHPSIAETKFVLAIVDNDLEQAKKIYPKLKININVLSWGGVKMVHLAIKNHRLDILKNLVAWGAQTILLDENGNACLEVAAQVNALSILSYLMNKDNYPQQEKGMLNDALYYAVRYGHLDSVKSLIESGANINHKMAVNYFHHHSSAKHEFISMLGLSIENNHPDITRFLQTKGAKTYHTIHQNNQVLFCNEITPLHVALNKGNLTLALSLTLFDKAILQVKSDRSFHGGMSPVESWIKYHLINETNTTTLSIILCFAILANEADSAKLLIDKGADIYLQCYDDKSPYQLSLECDGNEIKEIMYEAHKAANLGKLIGKSQLKPISLLYMSAKAASNHVLEIDNSGIGFFKNIPQHLEVKFNNDYQKIIIAASKNPELLELDQREELDEDKVEELANQAVITNKAQSRL